MHAACCLPVTSIVDSGLVKPERLTRVNHIPLRIQESAGTWMPLLSALLGFLLIAVTLQLSAGAYGSEFWGYDEAAHFVTGLMVHDYIAAGAPSAPMSFARDYYGHYPKVALGHWPPVFYMVQSTWTLLFSVSRTSLMLLQAVTASGISLLLWFSWHREWGNVMAFLAGASFLLLPVVQGQTNTVMAEMLLSLWLLLAVLQYESYLRDGKWRSVILFSCYSIAAILTKANGWCLMLVPPLAVVLTRKFYVLRRASFWIPALAVTAVCIPWYALTFHMAQEGWRGSKQPHFLISAFAFNTRAQLLIAGPFLIVLAISAVGLYVLRPALTSIVGPRWAVLFSLWIAVIVFHSFIAPVREVRHQMLGAPAVVSFAWGTVAWIATRVRWEHSFKRPLVAVIGMGIFMLTTFHLVNKPVYGATSVIALLQRNSKLDGNILVCSRLAGEGAIVAEAALLERHPAPTILRATKLFVNSDWGGWQPKLLVSTPPEVLSTLTRHNVSTIVIDLHPAEEPRQFAEEDLLTDTIKEYPGRFEELRPETKYFKVYSFRAKALQATNSLRTSSR
jgi:hypothetical protein